MGAAEFRQIIPTMPFFGRPHGCRRLPGSERAFTSRMDELLTIKGSLVRLLHSIVARLPFVLAGLVFLMIGILIARLAKSLVSRGGKRARLDAGFVSLISRVVSAAVILTALAVASVIIFPSLRWRDLVAGLGISSVAIGFALKDILQNFVAGVLLLWRRPFRIGDQIRTGEYEGTVEDIDVRSTRIRTYDNELVVVPNGEVYTKAMIVRTAFGHRRVRNETSPSGSTSSRAATSTPLPSPRLHARAKTSSLRGPVCFSPWQTCMRSLPRRFSPGPKRVRREPQAIVPQQESTSAHSRPLCAKAKMLPLIGARASLAKDDAVAVFRMPFCPRHPCSARFSCSSCRSRRRMSDSKELP